MSDVMESNKGLRASSGEVKQPQGQNSKNACYTGNTMYNAVSIVGNAAAGLGLGVVAGIGAIMAASVAKVAVPALLVLKAFGVTGGAFGFLRGIKLDNRKT